MRGRGSSFHRILQGALLLIGELRPGCPKDFETVVAVDVVRSRDGYATMTPQALAKEGNPGGSHYAGVTYFAPLALQGLGQYRLDPGTTLSGIPSDDETAHSQLSQAGPDAPYGVGVQRMLSCNSPDAVSSE